MNDYLILAESVNEGAYQLLVGVVATLVCGSLLTLGGFFLGIRIWPNEKPDETADRKRRENEAAVMELLNQSKN